MSTYTREQLEVAIATSTSIRQVLIKLGLAAKGGNNATIKRLAAKWNINTDHFTGQAHSRGKRLSPRIALDVYLTNQQPIGSFRLKNRLINEGVMKAECSSCGGTEWLNQPMPLELDHKDGNAENNSLSNLRLLCPNCHALTPTYRGKNQQRAKSMVLRAGLEPARP